MDLGNQGLSLLLILGQGKGLLRMTNVNQVVGNSAAIDLGRLGRTDIKFPVHLARISTQNNGGEAIGQG
jgi:hypothetical protein